ncbi:hypothetical protein WJW27_002649 [Escherichia coli]
MRTFTPRWDIKADARYIQEGQDILLRLSINKNSTTDASYVLNEDEYLEMILTIQCLDSSGTVFEPESHYTFFVGNDENSFIPISEGTTGNKFVNGKHKCKISKTQFNLSGSSNSEDVYFIKIHCKNDGTYNNTEIINFYLQAVNVMYFGNISPSGELGTTDASITYDSQEVWVTPGVEIGDDKKPYCIGDVDYGSNSTLFVQGFGRRRPFILGTDITDDITPRVFFPAYRLVDMDISEVPQNHITNDYAVFKPAQTVWPISGINKEVKVNIQNKNGSTIDTGMIFNPNGQLLQTFLYESEACDTYFKVEIVDILSTYVDDSERFAINQRYKAYQMWVCPEDIDTIYSISDKPLPNHLYQLKDNVVYPYVITGEYDDGTLKPVYDSSDWLDLGYYDPTLGENIIGMQKIFRVLVNAEEGNNINFITESDLGTIHVGEYFGNSVYPKIETDSKSQVSYILDGGDDIRKYGMDLTPDGYLVGTAFAKSMDFSANDDIKLSFYVKAFSSDGGEAKKLFNLKIVRGFGQNYLSAHVLPSVSFERDWFKCISTSSFTNQLFFRQSDDRYGLQKVPKMLLKENFLSQTYPYTNLSDIKKVLRKSIVDTNGTTIPNGKFKMVMGNYKLLSALDNQGNLQYDLLYREVLPEGSLVSVSKNPRQYTQIDNGLLGELFGLRQNIFKAIGEDTTNLIKDPTDLQNRGMYVDAIPSVSEEMLDTVPRFMNHPYIENNLQKKFMPIIPVAYCLPGKGEAFFNTLLQNNEHGTMVGLEFEITSVEFGYFSHESDNYVPDTFVITLPNNNIGV